MRKRQSSINGVGETVYSHANEWNWMLPLPYKNKMRIYEAIKWTYIRKVSWYSYGQWFFGCDPKNKGNKRKKKWDCIKLKSFFTEKKIVIKVKRQPK
jgi:hypothetical protein